MEESSWRPADDKTTGADLLSSDTVPDDRTNGTGLDSRDTADETAVVTLPAVDRDRWVSEQFLNGTSAHIRLFSALPWYGRFT